jgi:hypothetical protein
VILGTPSVSGRSPSLSRSLTKRRRPCPIPRTPPPSCYPLRFRVRSGSPTERRSSSSVLPASGQAAASPAIYHASGLDQLKEIRQLGRVIEGLAALLGLHLGDLAAFLLCRLLAVRNAFPGCLSSGAASPVRGPA